MMKHLLALVLALSASTAFAGNVTASINGREVRLPECEGTVQINNGGTDNQLNAVFRKVKNCSNIEISSGKTYKMSQPEGQRGGSYTVFTAQALARGDYYTQINVYSNSKTHYDTVTVYFSVR